MRNSTHCLVCGLDQGAFAWENNIPSHNICDCCGTEFGYHDCMLEGIKEHRNRWIDSGYKWFWPKSKPENWDPKRQLENIPEEFR